MICVSIGEGSVDDCIAALERCSFAEIRMDKLKCTKEDARRIFSLKKNLIATCRPGTMSDKERISLLIAAVEAGASYVDVELESTEEFRRDIMEKAREKGCAAIVSYHDYKKTPDRNELLDIALKCFRAGAKIAKIACAVHSERDNARLLGLLDTVRDIVVIGMGNKGTITRIVAPLLGSPFAYASASPGKETAAGQIDAKNLKKHMESLR